MGSKIRIIDGTPNVQSADALTADRFRTIIQDSHMSFLIGAGTSSPFFEILGNVENALTELQGNEGVVRLVRTSVQGHFFEKVLLPNLRLLDGVDADAKVLIKSYGRFIATLNRILLRRRNTLLGKQANLFTTNVDMALEIALDLLEISFNDGFVGKIRPRLDLGEFNTLRLRQGTRFEYRSEIPTMNLFKIHGSASWRPEGEEIGFDHQLQGIKGIDDAYRAAKKKLVTINSGVNIDVEALKTANADKSLDEHGETFATAYQMLQIVNPEKTKFASTVMNKTYYELIRRFANEMEKENSVLVVHGFSFRDEHLRDLVLRAAATNPTLQVIVFCFDRAACAEIAVLLPDEKVKNGNILLVQPSEPVEQTEERKITLDVLVEDYLNPVLDEKSSEADHVIELKLGGPTGVVKDA